MQKEITKLVFDEETPNRTARDVQLVGEVKVKETSHN